MEQTKISIIIPTHNEAENIGNLVREVRLLYPAAEVVVVDDGSTDGTAKAANEAGADVYSHPYNIGNGAAIKSGIRVASGDILVFMDGDGQHNPVDVARLLEPFPDYDMVVGARSAAGQASISRAFGNRVYNLLGSYVAKFPIKDLTSGFRAVKAETARSFLFLLPNTYSYPTTITLGVLRSGGSLKYIPIAANKRRQGLSQIKLVEDGVRFFMIIVRICTLYSPMRVFLPVSFCMFMIGLIRYIHSFVTEGRFTNMSALMFVSSVIIFMMSLISEQLCQMRFERRSGERRLRRFEADRSRQRKATESPNQESQPVDAHGDSGAGYKVSGCGAGRILGSFEACEDKTRTVRNTESG
jgi:glycosyltransferase involved in cell wall biosynthesis